jgi:hypothetical protein
MRHSARERCVPRFSWPSEVVEIDCRGEEGEKGLSRSRCEGAMGMDEKGSGAGAVIGNAYTKVETILRCCRGRG